MCTRVQYGRSSQVDGKDQSGRPPSSWERGEEVEKIVKKFLLLNSYTTYFRKRNNYVRIA